MSLRQPTKVKDFEPQPDESPEEQGVSWSWFQVEATLGQGTFGTVYKVKCLRTRTARKKELRQSIISANTKSVHSRSTTIRELIEGQYYVIKEIDTAKMSKEQGLGAMQEIELMGEIDCPYIVCFLDAFIVDTKINIVMEHCQHGDLQTLVKKQAGKAVSENLIWKTFI